MLGEMHSPLLPIIRLLSRPAVISYSSACRAPYIPQAIRSYTTDLDWALHLTQTVLSHKHFPRHSDTCRTKFRLFSTADEALQVCLEQPPRLSPHSTNQTPELAFQGRRLAASAHLPSLKAHSLVNHFGRSRGTFGLWRNRHGPPGCRR